MSWSPQQEQALKLVKAWLKDKSAPQVFRLFGFAGTGKTTLAKEFAEAADGNVEFATFTGKASLVLRSKGCEGASTIHSLIYMVETDDKTGEAIFKLNEDSELTRTELLIIDEVSMVGEELALDLLSFKTKVLVLGDPAQLPPVKDTGYFIDAQPDMMLTEVHRQALDNPIIRMSMDIREGRRLQLGTHGQSQVISRASYNADLVREMVVEADQVICGLNKTRANYNRRIRSLKALVGDIEPWLPTQGDRLICLKNKRSKALFNGSIWECEAIEEKHGNSGLPFLKLRVGSLDQERDPLKVACLHGFFNGTENDYDWRARRQFEEFTYGWAITCHKSQGSQWDNVTIFDESGAFREDARKWLYTAVTRAAEKVTVII